MDELIKFSINAKKKGLCDTYEITKEENIKLIDELFVRIGELGATCKDQMDFEQKFAASELFTEYSNLFMVLHNSEKSKHYQPDDSQDLGEYLKEELEDEVKWQAKEAVSRAVYGKILDSIGDNHLLEDAFLEADDRIRDVIRKDKE